MAVSPTASEVSEVYPHPVVDLGGTWEFRTTHPDDGSADWLPMVVPSNWHLAGLPNHLGEVWFQRCFQGPSDGFGAWWLRFGGVDYGCDVWLNGRLLGSHEGYFAPFEFPVTSLLQEENVLRVRVDAPAEDTATVWPHRKRLVKGILSHHDCRPGANDPRYGQDGCTGGIWNRVSLYRTGRRRIQRVQASSRELADGAAVALRVFVQCLEEVPEACSLHVQILDPQGATVAEGTRHLTPCSGVSEHTLIFTLADAVRWETWDRGGPALYRWRALLFDEARELDLREGSFGIREVELDGEWRWKLNGRRFFPRGTNLIPTQWLASYSDELIRRDVELLRQAGVNCVRVHAHVTRPEFYAACDAAGLLVWQDFALQWGYEESDDFRARAVSQIRDMGRLLYNHACVGVWCCHNEPTHNRHTLDPLLESALREVDATRPVVAASDFKQHPYPGWYTGHVEQFAGLPGAPLVTEYGAQALPSAEAVRAMLGLNEEDESWPPTPEQWQRWAYHDFQHDQTFRVAGIDVGRSLDEFVANSQAYQYRLLKYATELYRAHKYAPITGVFQFMFVDCWPAITWSVLDHARRPKKGFDALRLALQPVLVSAMLERHTLELGSLWSVLALCSPVVVNDRLQEFRGAVLEIALQKGDDRWVLQERTLDVPADGVVQPVRPMELLETPEGPGWKEAWRPVMEQFSRLAAGTYQVHYALTDAEGRLLSTNHEEVRLVEPVVPSPFQL